MKEVSQGNWRSEKGRPKEKTDIRCDRPKNMHTVLYRRQCNNPCLLKVLLQSDYAAKMCLCCETCEVPSIVVKYISVIYILVGFGRARHLYAALTLFFGSLTSKTGRCAPTFTAHHSYAFTTHHSYTFWCMYEITQIVDGPCV
jgi:hypothetical protein